MKRKNYTTKNSLFLEKNSFFSNKNNIVKGDKIMEVKITKTYKVGDKEFTSIEAVNQYAAEQTVLAYLNKGVDHVIENSTEFIKSLKILKGIKYSNVGTGKGNLKDINEHLEKQGSCLVRSTLDWPVYTVHTPDESFSIRFTGKVWELHGMIVNNPDWISEVKKYQN